MSDSIKLHFEPNALGVDVIVCSGCGNVFNNDDGGLGSIVNRVEASMEQEMSTTPYWRTPKVKASRHTKAKVFGKSHVRRGRTDILGNEMDSFYFMECPVCKCHDTVDATFDGTSLRRAEDPVMYVANEHREWKSSDWYVNWATRMVNGKPKWVKGVLRDPGKDYVMYNNMVNKIMKTWSMTEWLDFVDGKPYREEKVNALVALMDTLGDINLSRNLARMMFAKNVLIVIKHKSVKHGPAGKWAKINGEWIFQDRSEWIWNDGEKVKLEGFDTDGEFSMDRGAKVNGKWYDPVWKSWIETDGYKGTWVCSNAPDTQYIEDMKGDTRDDTDDDSTMDEVIVVEDDADDVALAA